jgi:hypothetical protein
MTRDELIASILAKSGPKPLAVDGLGFVRIMTAYDADQTRKKLEALKKDDGCETGRLLAMLLCDEDGALLFDASDAEAVLKLAKLPPELQMAALGAGKEAAAGPKG